MTTLTHSSTQLQIANEDFVLSRKALRCSKATLDFYKYTSAKFVTWLNEIGIADPHQVNARHVREFLTRLIDQGRSDWTVHDNARAIKTMLSFWIEDGYVEKPIKFKMPKLSKKRQPMLTADELWMLLDYPMTLRDKTVILIIADTGLRRSEVVRLNWGDLNIETGLIKVKAGKGGKDRSVFVGLFARKQILEYRRTLANSGSTCALIQTDEGKRFTLGGFAQVFIRLSARSGIYVRAHALRRTCTKLSLRAAMNPLHLKELLGHSTLDLVLYYAQLDDDDLQAEHESHGPLDKRFAASTAH
jgi:integrase/recombinase XerD